MSNIVEISEDELKQEIEELSSSRCVLNFCFLLLTFYCLNTSAPDYGLHPHLQYACSIHENIDSRFYKFLKQVFIGFRP